MLFQTGITVYVYDPYLSSFEEKILKSMQTKTTWHPNGLIIWTNQSIDQYLFVSFFFSFPKVKVCVPCQTHIQSEVHSIYLNK